MNPPRAYARPSLVLSALALGLAFDLGRARAQEADLILHNGKVVTVDRDFSIRQALAVRDGRLARIGSDVEVLVLRGPKTKVVDLGGKTVLPGLIDSHTHPTGACMTEFDHPIAEMGTIQDVLDYIRTRAEVLGPGRWVVLRQVFITRLKEQRYPTRAELDRVAPNNPVLFATGPRCLGQYPGTEAQRHRQGLPGRWDGPRREGPEDGRAHRHPPQLHPLHQGHPLGTQTNRPGP
jgi:hypothetical protein